MYPDFYCNGLATNLADWLAVTTPLYRDSDTKLKYTWHRITKMPKPQRFFNSGFYAGQLFESHGRNNMQEKQHEQ